MMTTTQFNKANTAATKATTGLAKKLPPPSTPAPVPMSAVGSKLANYKQLRYLSHIDQLASHANPELATIGKKLVTKASTTAPKAIAPMAQAGQAAVKMASVLGLDANDVQVLTRSYTP